MGAPLDDLRWLDQVPRERPGLFIAEGAALLERNGSESAANAMVAQHSPAADDFQYLQYDDRKKTARTWGDGCNLQVGAG